MKKATKITITDPLFNLRVSVINAVSRAVAFALIMMAAAGLGWVAGCLTVQEHTGSIVNYYQDRATEIVQRTPSAEFEYRKLTTYDDECIIVVSHKDDVELPSDDRFYISEDVVTDEGLECVVTTYPTDAGLQIAADTKPTAMIICLVIGALVSIGCQVFFEFNQFAEDMATEIYGKHKDVECDTAIVKEEKQPEKVVEDTAVDTDDGQLVSFRKTLEKNVNLLHEIAKNTSNIDGVRDSIEASCEILKNIEKYADERDMSTSSVRRLNGYFLPGYVKTISNYVAFSDQRDNKKVERYLVTMSGKIKKCEDMFKAIFADTIADDLQDGLVDASVMEQMAIQQGLLQGVNSLKSSN